LQTCLPRLWLRANCHCIFSTSQYADGILVKDGRSETCPPNASSILLCACEGRVCKWTPTTQQSQQQPRLSAKRQKANKPPGGHPPYFRTTNLKCWTIVATTDGTSRGSEQQGRNHQFATELRHTINVVPKFRCEMVVVVVATSPFEPRVHRSFGSKGIETSLLDQPQHCGSL
jgi:hypothetical protein